MQPTPELQSTLAHAMLSVAEGHDWSTVTVVANAIAARLEADCRVRLRAGRSFLRRSTQDDVSVGIPMAGSIALRDMRRAMATADHGTWFSATAVATRGADLSIDFNYHDQPQWDIEPEAEFLIEDLQHYPRPWAEIPAWHPVRTEYTEQSWEQFRATGR